MKKKYDIKYNDGAHYGMMCFDEDCTQEQIDKIIQREIENNNKNPNKLYHISQDNFVLTKGCCECAAEVNPCEYCALFDKPCECEDCKKGVPDVITYCSNNN